MAARGPLKGMHGILGPAAKDRAKVVPTPPAPPARDAAGADSAGADKPGTGESSLGFTRPRPSNGVLYHLEGQARAGRRATQVESRPSLNKRMC